MTAAYILVVAPYGFAQDGARLTPVHGSPPSPLG